jgi:glyoxylase-like metal-dependent hydrolase (beta-lactamase superfamily II)
MKKLLGCWFAVCFIFLVANFAYGGNGLVRISDHVYSYVDVKDGSPANSFGANAGVIIGEDGIVVVDTLVSAKEAKRFLQDIKSISDKPIRYVINTHYHLDHSFGNAEFAGLGADIIAHVNCGKAMRKSAVDALANANAYGLTPKDMEGTTLAYPVLTFTDKMEINLGSLKVELIYAAPSHSNGSIIVYIPDEGIVFTGDILFTDFHPYMADGDIKGWQEALNFIKTLNANKIIPGHGPISTNKDVADMKSYIDAFDKKAKELATGDNELEYIVAELKKSMPPRSRGEGLIQANVQGKYQKIANEKK